MKKKNCLVHTRVFAVAYVQDCKCLVNGKESMFLPLVNVGFARVWLMWFINLKSTCAINK